MFKNKTDEHAMAAKKTRNKSKKANAKLRKGTKRLKSLLNTAKKIGKMQPLYKAASGVASGVKKVGKGRPVFM